MSSSGWKGEWLRCPLASLVAVGRLSALWRPYQQQQSATRSASSSADLLTIRSAHPFSPSGSPHAQHAITILRSAPACPGLCPCPTPSCRMSSQREETD